MKVEEGSAENESEPSRHLEAGCRRCQRGGGSGGGRTRGEGERERAHRGAQLRCAKNDQFSAQRARPDPAASAWTTLSPGDPAAPCESVRVCARACVCAAWKLETDTVPKMARIGPPLFGHVVSSVKGASEFVSADKKNPH